MRSEKLRALLVLLAFTNGVQGWNLPIGASVLRQSISAAKTTQPGRGLSLGLSAKLEDVPQTQESKFVTGKTAGQIEEMSLSRQMLVEELGEFGKVWGRAWEQKESIRCPFWKRRAVDFLEASMSVYSFVLARHKSLNPIPLEQTLEKFCLSTQQVMDLIEADYVERQYYVTGRLTKQIYADDCFFDAPDPDMPVTGLTKYVDAISNLFERKSSQVQLLCIETIDDKTILARWRLEGTLKLPWRPKVKPYTGVTVYHLNEQGLVQRHTELWSITAFDAFVSVIFPNWFGAAEPAPSVEELMEHRPAHLFPNPAPLLNA